MRGHRWWAGVAGLTAVCVAAGALAACGDGSSDASSRAVVVAGATTDAGTARFHLRLHARLSGETSPSPDVTSDGLVDFAHDRGRIVPTKARSGDGNSTSEARWLGPVTYSKMGSGAADRMLTRGRAWLAYDTEREARSLGCPPSVAPAPAIAFGLSTYGAEDPSGVLDALRAQGATLHAVGTARIRGVDTTHWQVRLAGERHEPVHCSRVPEARRSTMKSLSHELDVWTDGRDRVRRARESRVSELSNTVGGRQRHDRWTVTTTTDLFDFGVPVDVVAPPARDVYDETDLMVAERLGPGDVRGGWRSVAHGTFGGTPWTIWFATTANGWRCYDSDVRPEGLGAMSVESYSSEGMPELPEHNGRPASCSPPGGSFGPPFKAYVAATDGDRFVLAGYADRDVDTVTLRFAGGSTQHLPVDPTTGVVEWAGPRHPAPKTLIVERESCPLEPRLHAEPGIRLPSAGFPCTAPS